MLKVSQANVHKKNQLRMTLISREAYEIEINNAHGMMHFRHCYRDASCGLTLAEVDHYDPCQWTLSSSTGHDRHPS